MENKKSYVIIIVILVLYLIFALLIYKYGLFRKKTSFILFSDNVVLSIKKNKYNFSNLDSEILKKKKFLVYDYNKFLGKYNINFSDDMYRVYGDDYNLVAFENNFLAIYSDKDNIIMNTNNIEDLDSEDFKILDVILKENGIYSYESLSFAQKTKINANGKDNAYIYNVSNNDFMNSDDKFFSIVFIADKNRYDLIKFDVVNSDNLYYAKSYYIEALIDIGNNGNDELIIDTLISSQNGTPVREVYEYKDNAYKVVAVTDI